MNKQLNEQTAKGGLSKFKAGKKNIVYINNNQFNFKVYSYFLIYYSLVAPASRQVIPAGDGWLSHNCLRLFGVANCSYLLLGCIAYLAFLTVNKHLDY